MMIAWTPNLRAWFKTIAEHYLGKVASFGSTPDGHHAVLLECGVTLIFDPQACCFEAMSHAPDFWRPEDSGISCEQADVPLVGRTPGRGAVLRTESGTILVDYDLPALVVWSLLRLEELGASTLDAHGRFPASESYFFKAGLLGRPVIDEWFSVLRAGVAQLAGDAALPRLTFSTELSCDVDSIARYAYLGWRRLLRQVLVDMLKRRDPLAPLRGLLSRAASGRYLSSLDPANQFDWIMREADKRQLQVTFYMLCDGVHAAYDGDYRVDWPEAVALVRRIEQGGHVTGIHPSYTTVDDYSRLDHELGLLGTAYDRAGVSRPTVDARMHFLRFRAASTLAELAARGIRSDATIGYAEVPGFRAGTCHPYPAFDLAEDRALNILVRPLIAMEKTVISPSYMGFGLGAEALAQFVALKRACRRVGGTFSLLWHNTSLLEREEKSLLLSVLDHE